MIIVEELVKILKEMPQDKSLTCQVVAENGDTWNCGFDVTDIESSWMVNIRVSHPQLTHLPSLTDKVNE